MGKRKWMGIVIAVLVALLAGPSLSAAAGPERINESFVLGDTGCQMNVVLDGGTGAIVSADLGPAFEPPPPPTPATGYSFDFTGTVFNVTGPVPFGVLEGNLIGGNITYNPSNFTVFSTDDYSTTYQGFNTVGFDVARIWVIYDISPLPQRFETHNNSPVRSVVANNQPEGVELPVLFDTFDLVTDMMDSMPALLFSPKSAFVLKNNGGTAITNTDIPTGLNSTDWPSPPSYFEVYEFDPIESIKVWSVSATIENLTPASVPSPPGGIIINSVASPAVQQSAAAPAWCAGPLTPEIINDTLVCKNCTGPDGNGIYACTLDNCETKAAVERNIMEKSGDGSTYCYYDKLGNRICKTI